MRSGPVASQEAIKQLGTNGGGFFNANWRHPVREPDALTNLISMFLIFASRRLTYTYGRMAELRAGWALLAAMASCFAASGRLLPRRDQANRAFAGRRVDQAIGNMEGKEARFGVAASALFATVTTDVCGA